MPARQLLATGAPYSCSVLRACNGSTERHVLPTAGVQDQTLGLAALGIQGTALTSLTSKEEAAAIYKRLDAPDGDIRLLYGAPPCQRPRVPMGQSHLVHRSKVLEASRDLPTF